MCRGRQIVLDPLIRRDRFQGSFRSAITVGSNEGVDHIVFAEFFHARCQDEQLTVVGHGHPCAVDGFIAKPHRVKFTRIQIDDAACERLVNQ